LLSRTQERESGPLYFPDSGRATIPDTFANAKNGKCLRASARCATDSHKNPFTSGRPGNRRTMPCILVSANKTKKNRRSAFQIKTRCKRNLSLTWPEKSLARIRIYRKFMGCSRRLRAGSHYDGPRLAAYGHDVSHSENVGDYSGKDLSFYRFNLKSTGKFGKQGWAFATLACVWDGMNAHSGWIPAPYH